MKFKTVVTLLSALAFCFSASLAVAGSGKQTEGEKMIAKGSRVSIEYTLYIDDGIVVDTNAGKAPLEYEQGANMIIPGLETGLEGLKAGDTKRVDIPPEDAYGAVNPDAYQAVPKDQIPPEAHKVGAMLQSKAEDGSVRELRVHEVRADTIVVDFNHPLAGKSLTFDIKVLDVQ